MQIKIFTIPVMGGEALSEEFNAFLRSRKILQVEQHLAQEAQGAVWCFCVRYLDGDAYSYGPKEKVDYKKVLDEESFARYAAMKVLRKKIADEEAVYAYQVFSDWELAELAKLGEITPASMKKVKGIGEKKVEKYGKYFLTQPKTDETSQQPDTPDS